MAWKCQADSEAYLGTMYLPGRLGCGPRPQHGNYTLPCSSGRCLSLCHVIPSSEAGGSAEGVRRRESVVMSGLGLVIAGGSVIVTDSRWDRLQNMSRSRCITMMPSARSRG